MHRFETGRTDLGVAKSHLNKLAKKVNLKHNQLILNIDLPNGQLRASCLDHRYIKIF